MPRKSQRILIVTAIYSIISSGCLCLADVILLKNGEKLEGIIIEEGSDTITIELGYGPMEIQRKEVQSIEKKDYVKPAILKEEEKRALELATEERREAYLRQVDEELAKIVADKIIKKNREYLVLREEALLQKRDILKKEIEGDPEKACLEKEQALEYTIGRLRDIWKFDPEYLPMVYSVYRALEDALSNAGSRYSKAEIIKDHKKIQTLSKEEIKAWVEEAERERTRKIMEFRRRRALGARRLPTGMPAEGEPTAGYGQTFDELAKNKRLQQLYGVEGEIQWNQRQMEYLKKLERVTVLRHGGVDISLPIGTPVSATGDGRVIKTGYEPYAGGKYVVIDHFNGLYSTYAHNSMNLAHEGQQVRRGEMIALSGNTGGEAFGEGYLYPHLHYKIHNKYGKPLDPKPFWKNQIPVVVPFGVWRKTMVKGMEEIAVGELKGDEKLKEMIEELKVDPKRQIDYFTGLEKAKDIGSGFSCSDVKFNYNYGEYEIETIMQGNITNNSGKDYKFVKFTLLLYGDSDVVLETVELTYNHFNNKGIERLNYKMSNCYLSEIRDYEIKFIRGTVRPLE